MTRLLLRFLNTPGLVLLAAVGVAIQTSLFASWPITYLQPDVILLVTLWCAFRRDFIEGGFVVLIIAEIAEAHSSGPQGLFLIGYMSLYLAVRAAIKLFVIPDISTYPLVTSYSSIFWKLTCMMVLYLLGVTGQWRNTLLFLFPGAVINALLGIWVYRWLEKFDRMTFKNRRMEVSPEDFTEDELRLDGAGRGGR